MRVVTMALIDMSYWLLSLLAVVAAFLTRYWVGFGFLCAGLLLCLLYLAIVRIPLVLNWSSNLYGSVFGRVFFLQFFSIATYALCYVSDRGFSSKFETYWEAVYFSATTWTTLGYGDISPVGSIRLLTSFEALTGTSTLAVLASVIWLYCDRRLLHRTQEEKDVAGYELTTDSAMGYFVEVDCDRVRKEQCRRDQIRLRACACSDSRPFIEKYYSIVGRLTPLPRFHVVCRGCGAFSKPRLNAYLAAWAWNEGKRGQSPTRRRCDGNPAA
jgi:hypothetical protein